MRTRSIALLACSGLCLCASAQIGTGTWTWEVSADGGATWGSGLVEVPLEQQQVRVRAVAAWSADAGGWFGGAFPDVLWSSLDGAGVTDAVAIIERSSPFDSAAQSLSAQRFGPIIKIDDVRDTMPPGEGTRSVIVSQLAPGFGNPNSENPAVLMEYRIMLDGTHGDRLASAIFRAPPVGNSTDRVFNVYTTMSGALNAPLMTIHNTTVRVVPAPSAVAVLAAALVVTRRTRRLAFVAPCMESESRSGPGYRGALHFSEFLERELDKALCGE